MARSAHAYVRGNTVSFYEWLESGAGREIPEGPPVWICGDCHLGNLGPVASLKGQVEIEIRDLDQTVIGNPAHDLVRLGLSLATAARGSDLPGVVTAHMLEALVVGYEQALDIDIDDEKPSGPAPEAVTLTMRRALGRKWKHLALERIADIEPNIPLGRKFWTLSEPERNALDALFETEGPRRLVTMLRSRPDDARIKVLDAAYWIKGCSSLGRLRYSVLVQIKDAKNGGNELCLLDIKEALKAAAPHSEDAAMPHDDAERVVAGARALSPYLGERMMPAKLNGVSVFLRELMPQDLKLEIETLSQDEAVKAARYLAGVIGKAHARQMDDGARRLWLERLSHNRSGALDAPSWLWRSVVSLVATHELGYLEHCRQFALEA